MMSPSHSPRFPQRNPLKRLSGVQKAPINKEEIILHSDRNVKLPTVSSPEKKITLNPDPKTHTRLSSLSEMNAERPLKSPNYFLSSPYQPLSQTVEIHWSLIQTSGNEPKARRDSSFIIHESTLFYINVDAKRKKALLNTFDLTTNQWESLRVLKSPRARSGFSTVYYRDQIVMYGGLIKNRETPRISGKLHIFNIQKRAWKSMCGFGYVPEPRCYHAAAQLGKHMIVYGGDLGSSQKTNELILFDLQEHCWNHYDFISPEKVSHATLTPVVHQYVKSNHNFSIFHLCETKCFYSIQNSGLYLFGGIDNNKRPNNTLYRLTGSKGVLTWEKIRTTGKKPSPRYAHSASSVGQYLFVFGGRDDSKEFDEFYNALNDLHVLNVITWKWEEIVVHGICPRSRWGHCMQARGTEILLLGGTNSKVPMSSSIYCLETDTTLSEELKRKDEALVRKNLEKTKIITQEYKEFLRTLVADKTGSG